MIREASTAFDRPEPGHYQGRLSAILGNVPAWLPPPPIQPPPAAERRWIAARARSRSGQLALPLQPR